MIPGRCDEACTGFHQTASQQRTLANGIASVLVTQFLGLLAQVEGIANFRIQQHLPGLLGEAVHAGVFGAIVQLAVARVH